MGLKAGVRRFVAAVGVLAAVTGVASGASASADPAPGLEYVNLGDSFSAGSGVSPMVAGTPFECWQSERNFAHIVAAERGYRLTDVSCGGATTQDFYEAQYQSTRPQLEALTPTTELVTLMIGGNNNSTFAGAMARCIGAMVSNPGAFEPCRVQNASGLSDPVVNETYPALVTALRDIHARSPRAQVVIAGYPWLLPASGSCSPQMPLAEGDVSYLRDLQATLNDAVRRAAAETDSTFVDMSQVSEGRDGCKPAAERLVEPMLFANQPVPVHPNAAGERALADQVLAAIGQ
ncbi:SGNH/GDSL hydrolase family protein [Rhodococcus tukisamuensis]|uniref:GDSL-like Lipase/Acylhydrolase family protein n=1 Tax=Rhodococcus tukisamuensis TaxID=168276 RepID=A0A1G7CXZ5_9NOCA|nr:SGNH/GDSL hydrolase family protein [Rhodococcus tukisamuensis]SDE43650.1 GDSL-like Lipase/Acylhydrolase family protein [Rhodococcus tukisamuensis]